MVGLDTIKIIRTSRLCMAFLITFFLTWYFEIPEKGWCFITLIVVLYEYTTVGGVLSKSWLRFAGTFSAAIYSMIIIYFFDNNAVINMIALMAGSFVYAFFFMTGNRTYIGLLGTITLTIMLINYNNIDATVLRPMNISIGIAISILTLLFFYPQYARDHVIRIQDDLLLQLVNMLNVFLDKDCDFNKVREAYLIYERTLLADIADYNRYNQEALFETKKVPEFHNKSLLALACTKRIYHLVSVFVFHLANDELRGSDLIHNNITAIRNYLQEVRKKFDCDSHKKIHITKLKLDTANSSEKPAVFLHLLFLETDRELSLLNKTLEEILLIRSNHYQMK